MQKGRQRRPFAWFLDAKLALSGSMHALRKTAARCALPR
jgi:hypothetical protein